MLERIGGEVIENSEFFPFAGALMPGTISYAFAGVRTIEITQTMTPLADSDVKCARCATEYQDAQDLYDLPAALRSVEATAQAG